MDIRLSARNAQGITPEQETEAERAISAADGFNQASKGNLVVIKMAHSKCATVSDRLYPSWMDGKENLLVLSSDGEANYFGNGALCSVLKEKFEGWSGGFGLGDSHGNGFWGGYPNHDELVKFVQEWFESLL